MFIFVLLCMHAGPKGLAASSWSADIGVVDLTILLVYTTVEGLWGNLKAIRVPSRENPRVVEGVG